MRSRRFAPGGGSSARGQNIRFGILLIVILSVIIIGMLYTFASTYIQTDRHARDRRTQIRKVKEDLLAQGKRLDSPDAIRAIRQAAFGPTTKNQKFPSHEATQQEENGGGGGLLYFIGAKKSSAKDLMQGMKDKVLEAAGVGAASIAPHPAYPPLDLGRNTTSGVPFTQESGLHCFTMTPTGSNKIFGYDLGSYHACVMTNVCLNDQNKGFDLFTNNNDLLKKGAYEFPKIMFMKRFLSAFKNDHSALEDAWQSDRYIRGTSVALAHAYCCSHPTHYAEPIGALNSALVALRANATEKNRVLDKESGRIRGQFPPAPPAQESETTTSKPTMGYVDRNQQQTWAPAAVAGTAGSSPLTSQMINPEDCPITSPYCIGKNEPIQQVMELSTGQLGGWSKSILRVVVNDFDESVQLANTMSRYGSSAPRRHSGFRCFEKLIVPGTYYEVWPNEEEGQKFRDTAYKYLSEKRKLKQQNPAADESLPKEEWISKTLQSGVNGAFARNSSRRVLLYAARTSKRKVVDAPIMVEFFKVVMQHFNGEVKTISFGKESFNSQAAHAQDADILIGIHGADLTNMIWQQKGRVVVELNPIFFFEPRFKLMADRLGLHYIPWYCTSDRCGFGGDRLKVASYERQTKAEYTFLWDERKIVSKNYGNFTWPVDKYISNDVCDGCDKMLCCSSVKSVNWRNRETDIKVEPHLEEIGSILVQGAIKMGWLPESTEVAKEVDVIMEKYHRRTLS